MTADAAGVILQRRDPTRSQLHHFSQYQSSNIVKLITGPGVRMSDSATEWGDWSTPLFRLESKSSSLSYPGWAQYDALSLVQSPLSSALWPDS